MAVIRSFRELNVYQLAKEQAKKIFVVTKSFPAEEKYSLTDQIRRSSRAVNAMLLRAGPGEGIRLRLLINLMKRLAKLWKRKHGSTMLSNAATSRPNSMTNLIKLGNTLAQC